MDLEKVLSFVVITIAMVETGITLGKGVSTQKNFMVTEPKNREHFRKKAELLEWLADEVHKDDRDIWKHLRTIGKPLTDREPESRLYLCLSYCERFDGIGKNLVVEIKKSMSDSAVNQRRQSVLGRVKSRLRSKKTSELIEHLEEYKRWLEGNLIVELRKAPGEKTLKGLSTLNHAMIDAIMNGENRLDQLYKVADAASQAIIASESAQACNHGLPNPSEEDVVAILDTLKFAKVHCNTEQISETRKSTYLSIFDSEDGNKHWLEMWTSFPTWLNSGDGPFWICGYPGSGKSSLMNFIRRNPNTETHLKKWAGDKSLLRAEYSCYLRGTSLQRSLIGLSRSLVYQILNQERRLAVELIKSGKLLKPRNEAWTVSKLQGVLTEIFWQPSICIFILIDGLDQFDDTASARHDFLLFLIRLSQKSKNVLKFCFSAQPNPIYKVLMKDTEILKLGDLNRLEIEAISKVEVSNNWLAQEISHRSEGVFLWATIATSTVVAGIAARQTDSELVCRLDGLPQHLEALFAHMLSTIEQNLRCKAAQYFKLLLTTSGFAPDAIDFVLSANIGFYELFRNSDKDGLFSMLQEDCENAASKIRSCTGGLLVLSGPDLASSICSIMQPAACKYHWDWTPKVSFLHPMIFEFFQKSERATAFLNENLPDNFDVYLAHTKGHIVRLAFLPQLDEEWLLTNKGIILGWILFYLQQVQSIDEQTELFADLNSIIGLKLYGSATGHWKPESAQRSPEDCKSNTDLLYSASEWGLLRYVQKHLNIISSADGYDIVKLTYVLESAVRGMALELTRPSDNYDPADFPSTTSKMDRMIADRAQLISYLLQQGADPSLKLEESESCTSVWTNFLHHFGCSSRGSSKTNELIRRHGIDLITSFIQKGADLNTEIELDLVKLPFLITRVQVTAYWLIKTYLVLESDHPLRKRCDELDPNDSCIVHSIPTDLESSDAEHFDFTPDESKLLASLIRSLEGSTPLVEKEMRELYIQIWDAQGRPFFEKRRKTNTVIEKPKHPETQREPEVLLPEILYEPGPSWPHEQKKKEAEDEEAEEKAEEEAGSESEPQAD